MDLLFLQILVSVFLVSAVSFVGILGLARKGLIHRLMLPLVSFAAGALLATGLLDLLPEALADAQSIGITSQTLFTAVLAGILVFFAIERLLHWHHHHTGRKDVHAFNWLNIIGDGVHNFLDGVAIAAAFLTSPGLGVATTIAVIAHEIPQEIGDFSLLLYGGWSIGKALTWNFLSALTAVAGAVVAYAASSALSGSIPLLGGFAAGCLIYIAAADLVPELHKEENFRKSLLQIILFLVGIWAIASVVGLFAA